MPPGVEGYLLSTEALDYCLTAHGQALAVVSIRWE